MRFAHLVLANLGRHKRRTVLTVLSVALALFLFASLRSVVTTLATVGQAGSETRMIVRNAIGIVFPVPLAYRSRLQSTPGVSSVGFASWFGGVYQDPRQFFPSFAVDPVYLDLYPEIVVPAGQREAFLRERSAAIVGEDLMRRHGWRLGQNVTLKGTIYPGDWTFTIRGVYTVTNPSFDELSFIFHYAYLEERMERRAEPGWYVLRLSDPSRAAAVAQAVDDQYRNSSRATRTETERAFQASFISMYGNVSFLMNSIGMAVVFAILLVCANAMMMAARERTGEVGVLKAIGFPDRTLFTLVMAESAAITLTGAALGVGGAWGLYSATNFNAGGFLQGFTVTPATMLLGLAMAVALALVSGIVPALRAARLSVVQALRTVE